MNQETTPAELAELLHMPGDEDTTARLHDRLTAAAERDALLDVAYRTVDSPVGRLLLARTDVGLVRVAYPEPDDTAEPDHTAEPDDTAEPDHTSVLASLAETISPRILHAPGELDEAAREFDEYFTGQRIGFELPLDLRLSRGFRAEVLDYLPQVGYGSTASYGQVAAAVGRPRAVRAVGTACARNPLPVVVPCHRVVRSDGSVGAYAGGAAAKRHLLALEEGTMWTRRST